MMYYCAGAAVQARGSKINCMHTFMLAGIPGMPFFPSVRLTANKLPAEGRPESKSKD